MVCSRKVALVVLVCFVGQTLAREIFSIIHYRNHHSHKKLAKLLEEKLPKHNPISYAHSVAIEVTNLLAQTEEKYHVGAVLDKYSVDEVLSLNYFTLTDCYMTEFKRRDELCHGLNGNVNLHKYCTDCIAFYDFNCKLNKQLVLKLACKEMTSNSKKTLEDFTKNVIEASELEGGNLKDNLVKVIELELARVPKQNKLLVTYNCQKLNRAVEDLYHVKLGLDGPSDSDEPDFNTIHAVCKIIGKLTGRSQATNVGPSTFKFS